MDEAGLLAVDAVAQRVVGSGSAGFAGLRVGVFERLTGDVRNITGAGIVIKFFRTGLQE